ncbi:putative amidoligase domain-containing protein [Anaerobacillus sp. MEB173]|uniref:putative amidoligase domain-containing protein n=1 Tax=Anaerobacillus sp. MEB173 TaxID=3383345 RepID=UPI003F8F021E
MKESKKIKQFYEKIGHSTAKGMKEDLVDHGINVTNLFDRRKTSLKIRNFHYEILSCEVHYPKAVSVKNQIVWENLDHSESFYMLTEMKELALQAMYFLNIPLGECIVQRNGKKSLSIFATNSLFTDELTSEEANKVCSIIESYERVRYLSFGADVEVLIRNWMTNKWINVASFVAKDGNIGYDSAIALHENRVTHPVLELRPKYAYSGEELHGNLLREYNKLEDALRDRNLEAVGGSNPYGRYLLGGHLHLGNQPLTFKHVRVLDEYLALPFALLGEDGDLKRRQHYGRLGNIRRNLFQGFEYRTLPSWYRFIPTMLPMINWFEFLCRHSTELPNLLPTKSVITAYYDCDKDVLSEYVIDLRRHCKDVLTRKNYQYVALPFFQWIEAQLKK